MKQVTKDDFFNALSVQEKQGKDIMPKIENEYVLPYTSIWSDKSRNIFGKSIGANWSLGETETKYFLL